MHKMPLECEPAEGEAMSALHFKCVVKQKNVWLSDCNNCDFCTNPSGVVRNCQRRRGKVTLLPEGGVIYAT